MLVNTLSATGPAVAALLQEAARLHGPFDGLLLGSSRVRTEAVIHDTREDTTAQFLELGVSTFCCCAGLGSFYDAAGSVHVEEVRRLAGQFQGSLLGWFVAQQGPLREPSIRERAVTAAFAQLVDPGTPVLFALVASQLEPGGATVSFQQRFFQQEPMTVILRPLELRLENIGSSKQTRDYRPLRPIASLAPVGAAAVEGEAWEVGGGNSDLGRYLVQGAQAQAEGMERLYGDLLRDLEAAAGAAGAEQAALASLRHEVQSLAASLGL